MACTQTCCPGTPVILAQPVISTRAGRRAEGQTPTPHRGCRHRSPTPAGLAKPELRSAQEWHGAVSHGSQGPLPRPSPCSRDHHQPHSPQNLAPPGTAGWPGVHCSLQQGQTGHLSMRAAMAGSWPQHQLTAAPRGTRPEPGGFWHWEMGAQGQRPTSRAAFTPFHEGNETALLAGSEHRVKTCPGD